MFEQGETVEDLEVVRTLSIGTHLSPRPFQLYLNKCARY